VRVVPGGNVVLAGHVPVAQLITTDVKSALHPGDTVRITAAPLDANGASLLDRKVSWQSANADIASVDAFGLVTARTPGTTEILATSEQQTAHVSVTVTPRAITYADAPSALRGGVERFVNAINQHDTRQIAAPYYVESPDDQKNLDWLLDKARNADGNLRITRVEQGRINARDAEATTDIGVTIAWTEPNGRNRDRKVKFRIRSTKTGDSWSQATVRSLDALSS
jgi:hypothetical protein